MQRRVFLMTLLRTFSGIKSFKHRASIWPSLKNASRSKASSMCNNRNSQLPAFQCHRYFSAPALDESPPLTTLFSSHHTKSNLITKSDPVQISPEKDYIMCFAGRSRGIAGSAGSGMVLFDGDGSELWWGRQQLGGVSLNEADYISLVTGLECARSLGVQRITAQGCNDLLFRQMEGTNKVKKPSLKEYYGKAMEFSREFSSFQMREVEKSLNKRAIQLAIEAMDMQNAGMIEPDNAVSVPENSGSDSEDLFAPGSSNNSDDVAQSDLGSISPEKTYVLRFDGGSRGNPGNAGTGMVLYDSDDGSELWSACQYIGDRNTNNEAEYMGLITGLRCARSLGVENIVVQGDSQLILRQVEGTYKVKSPSLKYYYNQALSLSKEFATFQTSHIERARNGRADELANEAMDTRQSRGFDIS